ncbi:Slit protein [Nesidiocoris tenuis]|nr:Slit protein [Nesidiocoris tenuis]
MTANLPQRAGGRNGREAAPRRRLRSDGSRVELLRGRTAGAFQSIASQSVTTNLLTTFRHVRYYRPWCPQTSHCRAATAAAVVVKNFPSGLPAVKRCTLENMVNRGLDSNVVMMIFLLVLFVSTVTDAQKDVLGGRISGHPIPGKGPGGIPHNSCPWTCTCVGLTVDCSRRALIQVPKNLPRHAERL